MIPYSTEPTDRIFTKGYGFLFFTKNIFKNITTNLSSKYSPGMLATRQKPLDHVKESVTHAHKIAS